MGTRYYEILHVWVSYQNTSLFRNLAKYTNIPHVCCPNFDSIPIYLILGVRYTNIPHVFWKFQQYTNIPHAWFGRAKRAYQYTSCFRKMAKYTNIPQFNEYEETITSPLLYRYLPYIICAQCMNNVIWIFLVSTWNCRVKLIEILSVPAVPWYHTLLYWAIVHRVTGTWESRVTGTLESHVLRPFRSCSSRTLRQFISMQMRAFCQIGKSQ